MGALSETEIFDCLATNLRLAAEDAEALATATYRGEVYDRYRRELKLVEGACYQATHWREDARWLVLAKYTAECHERAGVWLRGWKTETGVRVKPNRGTAHPLFLRLAELLRDFQRKAERLKTMATYKCGMILPVVRPGPHRETTPVQVALPRGMVERPSGLIVPA